MRHPAFNTDSDTLSRKAKSSKVQNKKSIFGTLANSIKKSKSALSSISVKSVISAANSAVSSLVQKAEDLKQRSQFAKQQRLLQQQQQATQQLSTDVDLDRSPIDPTISSDVYEFELSADIAVSALDSASSAVFDSQSVADDVNKMLSNLCLPIYSALKMLKSIPPKLNSIVDVEGAKNGMYAGLSALKDTWKTITTTYTSVEVPITLDDYQAKPSSYPRLEALHFQANSITEADCLSSGYTKTALSSTTSIISKLTSNVQKPIDNDTIAKNCEKMLGTIVKQAWAMVQPPIQAVASIANVGPIDQMVTSVTDAIDGFVKIAETPIPEDALSKKIKDVEMATENLANQSEQVANEQSKFQLSQRELMQSAIGKSQEIKDQLAEQKKEVLACCKDAFAKMKMPTLPDGIDDSLEEVWKSVQMVVANIQNVFIVILFKLMEAVFKCFNQILGVIGVPSLPPPLNILPQLITNVNDIMVFLMALPMSMTNQVNSVVKRKAKAAVVADMPMPPPPVPEVVVVPPTSQDAPKPSTTWENVQEALKKRWNFSAEVSRQIVNALQKFFDGTDSKEDILNESGEIIGQSRTPVLIRNKYIDSLCPYDVDCLPEDVSIKRTKIQPQEALEEWIPQHIDENISLDVPVKTTSLMDKRFYTYYKTEDGKWKKNYKTYGYVWEIQTYYTQSALNPK